MKKLFLTSWIGGYDREDESKTPTKLNNTNYFVDRLRDSCNDIKIVTYIASDPDDFDKCDEHSERLKNNLILEGFNVDKVYVVDSRCNFSIADAIKISEMVFLAGGHVPTQNKFFNKIGLKTFWNSGRST